MGFLLFEVLTDDVVDGGVRDGEEGRSEGVGCIGDLGAKDIGKLRREGVRRENDIEVRGVFGEVAVVGGEGGDHVEVVGGRDGREEIGEKRGRIRQKRRANEDDMDGDGEGKLEGRDKVAVLVRGG